MAVLAVANGVPPGVTAVVAHIPGLLVDGLTNDSSCLIYSSCSKLIALQLVLRIGSFLAEVRS